MPRRRVLVFSWFYLPFLGGAELFVQALAARLRERFEFVVVTARLRGDLPAREDAPGVTVHRVGLGRALDKFLYLAAAPLQASRLGSFDLVHAVMASGGAFAAAAYLKARRVPSLLSLQDGDSEEYVRSYLGPLFPAWRPLHRQFDRVHAISSALAERARRFGVPAHTVTVIPNGCEDRLLDAPPVAASVAALRERHGLATARVIVSVSRLVLKNGIDRLLRAMPDVVAEVPEAILLLVGDGPDRRALEEQARGAALGDRVRFVGEVPPAEVPPYLGLAEVFVRPSRSEGLGTAFLEAMACGLPIVGSRAGGIPDFLAEGRTGFFCDPEQPRTIADALLRLLRDPAAARRMGQAGRDLVRERYRWEVVAAEIGALYDRLLSEESRPRTP
jgi:glycosyltransferase involved in cell wall biosynthesis